MFKKPIAPGPGGRAALDAVAIAAVNAFRLVVQVLTVPVLSRLLTPADYGLVAVAMPAVVLALVFADSGIAASLLRTPAADRAAWSAGFWLSVLFGAALLGVMAAAAPLLAAATGEPGVAPVVRGLAVAVFLQAVCSVPGAALQQAGRFGAVAGIEGVAMLAGIAAAVAAAAAGGGAWALVGQQVAFYLVKTAMTLTASPFRPVWRFAPADARDHLAFGRHVLGVNLVEFLGRSLDGLVIGAAISATAAGLYAMAAQFVRLPGMLVSGPLQFAFYPRFAAAWGDGPAVRAAFLALTRVVATVVGPGVGLVAAAHGPAFALLLSERWAVSGRVFMLAAAAAVVQSVLGLCGTVRMAAGRADLQFRAAAEAGLLWLAVLIVSSRFGLDAVAAASSLTAVAYAPRAVALTLPLVGCRPRDYLAAVATPAAVTAGCVVGFVAARGWLPPGDTAQVAAAAAVAVSGVAFGLALQRRKLRADLAAAAEVFRGPR